MEKVVSVMFSYAFFSGQFRIFENSYDSLSKESLADFLVFIFCLKLFSKRHSGNDN